MIEEAILNFEQDGGDLEEVKNRGKKSGGKKK